MTAADKADVLWAKLPFKSLIHHLIDTGACASVLARDSFRSSIDEISKHTGLTADEAVSFVSYVAAMHDIGKAHPAFQRKAIGEYQEVADRLKAAGLSLNSCTYAHPFRHEIYSRAVLRRIWKSQGVPDQVCRQIGAVEALHHQGNNTSTDSEKITLASVRQAYEPLQNDIETRVHKLFPCDLASIQCDDWNCVCTLLWGIVIVSDWLASDDWAAKLNATDDSGYLQQALASAETAIHGIGMNASPCFTPASFSDLFPAISDNSMRPMQKAVYDMKDVPQFAIMEDITGSGKTEAAVYLAFRMMSAYNRHGFYFALPTAATSNQMFTRMKSMFRTIEAETHGQSRLKLLHGTAWTVDEDSRTVSQASVGSETPGPEWLAPARKGLLTENAVGTVDQVMMSVMQIKYSVLRLLGLTEKVLIIDEIHAYDAYMSDIIECLLSWCRDLGIPVILLSATLPNEKKESYLFAYTGIRHVSCTAYPLLTAYTPGKLQPLTEIPVAPFRNFNCAYEISTGLNQPVFIAQMALDMVKNGGNICVLANTVKSAQSIYSAIVTLQMHDPDPCAVLLYHARFTVEKRVQIEEECLRRYARGGQRPHKSILVATQVVEQSLDVDFDGMITELAPIDLLIQRAGRIHRHKNTRPAAMASPKMIILVDSHRKLDGSDKDSHLYGTYAVYDPDVLDATQKYLMHKPAKTLCMPTDLRDAIETVYQSVKGILHLSEQRSRNHAMGSEIAKPDGELFWAYDLMSTSAAWGNDPGDGEGLSDQRMLDGDALGEQDSASPSTREASRSVRVVLANEALYADYQNRWWDPDIQKAMLMKSVSLPLKQGTTYGDPEVRGKLKGYIICHSSTNMYPCGKIMLKNDVNLGVMQ